MRLHFLINFDYCDKHNISIDTKKSSPSFELNGPLVEHIYNVVIKIKEERTSLAKGKHDKADIIIELHDFSNQQDFYTQNQAVYQGKIPSFQLMQALAKALQKRFQTYDDKQSIKVTLNPYLLGDDLQAKFNPGTTTAAIGKYFEAKHPFPLKQNAEEFSWQLASFDDLKKYRECLEPKDLKLIDKKILLYRILQNISDENIHVCVYTHFKQGKEILFYTQDHPEIFPLNLTIQFFSYHDALFTRPTKVVINPIFSGSKQLFAEGSSWFLHPQLLYPAIVDLKSLPEQHQAGKQRARRRDSKYYQHVWSKSAIPKVTTIPNEYSCCSTAAIPENSVPIKKEQLNFLQYSSTLEIWVHFDGIMGEQNLHFLPDGKYKVSGPIVQHILQLIKTLKPNRVELHNNSRAQSYRMENDVSRTRLVSSMQAFEALAYTLKINMESSDTSIVINPFLLADTCLLDFTLGNTWELAMKDISEKVRLCFPRTPTPEAPYPKRLQIEIAQSNTKLDSLYVRLQHIPLVQTHIVAIESNPDVIGDYEKFLKDGLHLLPKGYHFTLQQYNASDTHNSSIETLCSQTGRGHFVTNGTLLTQYHTKVASQGPTNEYRHNAITLKEIQAYHQQQTKADAKLFTLRWFDETIDLLAKLSKTSYPLNPELAINPIFNLLVSQQERLRADETEELHVWLDFDGCLSPENIQIRADDCIYVTGPIVNHIINMIYEFKTGSKSKSLKVILSSFSNRQSYYHDNKNSMPSFHAPNGAVSSLQVLEALQQQLQHYFSNVGVAEFVIELDRYLLTDTFSNEPAGKTWELAMHDIYDATSFPFPIDPRTIEQREGQSILDVVTPSHAYKMELFYCKLQRLSSKNIHILIYDDRNDILDFLHTNFTIPAYQHLIPANVTGQFFLYEMHTEASKTKITPYKTAMRKEYIFLGTGTTQAERTKFFNHACDDFKLKQDKSEGILTHLTCTIEHLMQYHGRHGGNKKVERLAKDWPLKAAEKITIQGAGVDYTQLSASYQPISRFSKICLAPGQKARSEELAVNFGSEYDLNFIDHYVSKTPARKIKAIYESHHDDAKAFNLHELSILAFQLANVATDAIVQSLVMDRIIKSLGIDNLHIDDSKLNLSSQKEDATQILQIFLGSQEVKEHYQCCIHMLAGEFISYDMLLLPVREMLIRLLKPLGLSPLMHTFPENAESFLKIQRSAADTIQLRYQSVLLIGDKSTKILPAPGDAKVIKPNFKLYSEFDLKVHQDKANIANKILLSTEAPKAPVYYVSIENLCAGIRTKSKDLYQVVRQGLMRTAII